MSYLETSAGGKDLRARAGPARRILRERLIAAMRPDGLWAGCLSPSAVSTATAVSALSQFARARNLCPAAGAEVVAGTDWLWRHPHPAGGWGDTPESPANLPATLLTLAALRLAGRTGPGIDRAMQAGWDFVRARIGSRSLHEAVQTLYGADRTFAVPILMNCALAGMVRWEDIPRLPHALALLPPAWLRFSGLRVVSYALPALIAIGLRLGGHDRAAWRRWASRRMQGPLMRRLGAIQPAGGGFLEAAPLTAFVAMALLSPDRPPHPVAIRCIGFLQHTLRPGGHWPIDRNLSLWLTSHALQALDASDDLPPALDPAPARRRLAGCQSRRVHPATGAPPGGWAWTHLDGGVPDTDDTAAAILALLDVADIEVLARGVRWLRGLQNSDGGWPTFCRGWGRLPFDRSTPDLTAHALRALHAAHGRFGDRGGSGFARIPAALRRGLSYLADHQTRDGAWLPLWFGSQARPDRKNPVLGTALVLKGIARIPHDPAMSGRAIEYLCRARQTGGWGAAADAPPTLEETACALGALARYDSRANPPHAEALARGTDALTARIENETRLVPAPIGLYFADLWYAEELYPLVWSLDALNAVAGRPEPPRH